MTISNFWASDGTPTSGGGITGEDFPAILRVWGKLTSTEVSDKFAVFFDSVKPFRGVSTTDSNGLACNVTGQLSAKLTACSGLEQTGKVNNADIVQAHRIIYEFDKIVDADKWFELIIPIETEEGKFTPKLGFAVLTDNADLGEGYYTIKELKLQRGLSDLATTTDTLDLANDADLKGINYKLWFDYDTTREYKTGGSTDLTILLQQTDTNNKYAAINYGNIN
jgi:hypothetical protein